MALTPTTQRNYASNVFDRRTRKGRGYRDRKFDLGAALAEMGQRPQPRYNENDLIHFRDGTTQRIVWASYSASRKEWQYRITTGIQNRFGGDCISGNHNESELIALDVYAAVVRASEDLLFNPQTRQLEALPKKSERRIITGVHEVPFNPLLSRHSPVDEKLMDETLRYLSETILTLINLQERLLGTVAAQNGG